jgi:hypothetical protein
VSKTLNCWPALPIVAEYGGSSELRAPYQGDEEDVVAALRQSERVSSIHLTVTKSLLKKLSSIGGPFSELEDLVLRSQDGRLLTLPRTFRSGPRLRRLHLTGVAFSAPLRQLLSSSKDLVKFHLHDTENRYSSPNALAGALSGMAHLRSLSLRFLSTANHSVKRPLSKKRVVKRNVIPSLSCLKYRGTSKYVDGLLARLNAPRLADIEFTFFNETQYNVSSLSEVIGRTEMWNLNRQVDILFSGQSVSISLTRSAFTCLKLQVLCEPFSQQLLSMAQICSNLSALHLRMEEIRIKVTPSSSLNNTDFENWATLLYSFNGSKRFHLAGDSDMSSEVRSPLRLSEGLCASPLPVLPKLRICELGSRHPPLREAVVSLMVDGRLSGRPIEVEYAQLRIDELAGRGTG